MGLKFEVSLCTLLFLRCQRLCADFWLASNHANAGYFDDIVLIYRFSSTENYRTILIQAKCKMSTKIIKRSSLLLSRSIFGLRKYYESFISIKECWQNVPIGNEKISMEKVTYVLYTNAKADFGSAAINVSENELFSDIRILLLTERNMVQFQYNEVNECFTGDAASLGLEFLNNFVLCFDQLNPDEIDKCIVEEIFLSLNSQPADRLDLFHKMSHLLFEWHNQVRDAQYLTKNSDIWKYIINFQLEKLNKNIISLTNEIPLQFSQNCLTRIKSSIQKAKHLEFIVNDVSQSTLLTLKFYQSLDKCIIIDVHTFIDNWAEVAAVWKTVFCDTVVVDMTQLIHEVDYNDLITNIISEIDKTLILITKRKIFKDWCEITDMSTKWVDLDHLSQSKLLSCPVNFQGIHLSLTDFITNHPIVCDSFSDQQFLYLSNEPKELILGHECSKVADFFVYRHLDRRTSISESFFSVFSREIVIIAIIGIFKEQLIRKFGTKFKICVYEEMQETFIGGLTIIPLPVSNYDQLFSDLCIRYSCKIFLLKYIKGKFMYIKSRDGLDIIRKHVKDEITDSIDSIWKTDERNIIVSGGPGMGKSCILNQMNNEAKNKYPLDWVLNIDMRDYRRYFNANDFNCLEDVKTFLKIASLSKSNSSAIEEILFDYALEKSGSVILFLDSLDIICSRYTRKCYSFLSSLLKCLKYRKLVVSSRPTYKIELEIVLNTIAYDIPKFSEDEMLKFVQKYFISCGIYKSEAEILSVVKNIGFCLQSPTLGMMATKTIVMSGYTLQESNLVVMICQLYVEKLIMIFLKEKYQLHFLADPITNIIDIKKESIIKQLMDLAVVTMMTPDELHTLSLNNTYEELKDTNLDFLSCYEGSVKFNHHILAEYFFGMWLSKNYLQCKSILVNKLFGNDCNFVMECFNCFLFKDIPLHVAVANNNKKLVKSLLSITDVNISDLGGRTPLHVAAMSALKDSKILNLLINAGLAIDKYDNVLNWTALQYSTAVNNWEMSEILLSAGANTNVLKLACDYKLTKDLLEKFCLKGYMNLSLHLLKKHNELLIARFGENGNSLLHCAAFSGSVTLVSYLLSVKVKTDTLNNDELTAICIGAEKGNKDVVVLLHTFGASTSVAKTTPLHCASRYGHTEIVNYLLLVGTPVDEKSSDGSTPLIIAASYNHTSTLRTLIKNKADIEQADYSGFRALHWASMNDCTDTLHLLLKSGSEVNSVDKDGQTALHWVCRQNNVKLLEILLCYGASVNVLDIKHKSALYWASKNNNLEAVNLLLKNGADINSVSKKVI